MSKIEFLYPQEAEKFKKQKCLQFCWTPCRLQDRWKSYKTKRGGFSGTPCTKQAKTNGSIFRLLRGAFQAKKKIWIGHFAGLNVLRCLTQRVCRGDKTLTL